MEKDKELEEKLTRLFLLYEKPMYAVAYSILKNKEETEDIVQDVFFQIIEHFEAIQDVLSLQTKHYVLKVTKNKAIDLYRIKSKKQDIPFDEYIETDVGKEGLPEEVAEKRNRKR